MTSLITKIEQAGVILSSIGLISFIFVHAFFFTVKDSKLNDGESNFFSALLLHIQDLVVFANSGNEADATTENIGGEKIINLHIEKLPEGSYLATTDDLPKLSVKGQTIAETLEMANDEVQKLLESQKDLTLSPVTESFDYPLVVNQ